jgi:hypothetical protein
MGNQMERIVVFKNSTPIGLAQEFANKNNLDYDTMLKLKALLEQ